MVVGAAADPEAEGEAAAGEAVQGGGLLGEQGGFAQRRQQNLGLQADAGGGAGEHREGDQRLGVVVDDPVEQAEGAERAVVGQTGPVGELFGAADGQAETDVHEFREKTGITN